MMVNSIPFKGKLCTGGEFTGYFIVKLTTGDWSLTIINYLCTHGKRKTL